MRPRENVERDSHLPNFLPMTQMIQNAPPGHGAARNARHASLGVRGLDEAGARTTRGARMALELAIVGLAVAVVLWVSYGSMLFQARYPLAYDGDALSHAMLVKSVIDDGWFPWRSSSLGAPFGTVFLDYPSSDGLSILTMKVIAWFGSDWVSVLNRFYLLTFFSVAWVAYAVLRSFSIDRLWCLLGAVLFSCAPYHFLRVEHLLLASYLSVPLAIWLAARVFQSRGPAKLSTISALATAFHQPSGELVRGLLQPAVRRLMALPDHRGGLRPFPRPFGYPLLQSFDHGVACFTDC